MRRLVKKIVVAILLANISTSVLWAKNTPSIAQIEEAALEGDGWAQLNLGAAYDHGLTGKPVDAQLAVHWYRKSAQQGIAKAQFNLAHCLATGHGTEQNFSEALTWFEKSANQGDADAQFLLGVMYQDGLGTDINHQKAQYWLNKAAENGNQSAQHLLTKSE